MYSRLALHSMAIVAAVSAVVFLFLYPPQAASLIVSNIATTEFSNARKVIVANLSITRPGDGYLRVNPDACIYSVQVDGEVVSDPQIPFCGDREGRVLYVPVLKDKGTFYLRLVTHSDSSGNIKFKSELSAWKVLGIWFSLLAFCIFALASLFDIPLLTYRRSWFWGRSRNVAIGAKLAAGVISILWSLLYFRFGDGYSIQNISVIVLNTFFICLLYGGKRGKQNEQSKFNSCSGVARFGLIMGTVAIGLVVGILSSLRHYNLGSHAFDLAIQENVLWNTINGHPFLSSVMNGIPYLGNHTVVAYVLLLPFYYLFPSTYTLLWIQTILFVSTVIPLFFIARKLLHSEVSAAVLAASFLLHPALLGACCNDFHELSLAPCALAWVAYGVVTDRRLILAFATLITSCIKEDMSLNLLVLGGGLAVLQYPTRGLYLMICGAASYIVWQNVVITTFAGFESSYTWYLSSNLGEGASPISIILQLLEAPFNTVIPLLEWDKINFLMLTIGAFLFIPFLSIGGLIMTSYGCALVALSGHWPLYHFGYHYVFAWLTLAALATILYIGQLSRQWAQHLLSVLVLIAHGALFVVFGPVHPVKSFRYGPSESKNPFRSATTPQLINAVSWANQIVPASASVLTTESLVPHFARRERVAVIDRVGAEIRVTFDYCMAPRVNPSTTCTSLGCKGNEVPGPFSELLVCRQK